MSFADALKEFHGEEEVFGVPVSNTDVFIDCTGNHKLISDIINFSKKSKSNGRFLIAILK